MVAAIVELLGSPCFHPAETAEHCLVPTYDLPGFNPRRYWRGPVWINTGWLLWLGLRQHGVHALAAELRADLRALVSGSGCRQPSTPSAARATAQRIRLDRRAGPRPCSTATACRPATAECCGVSPADPYGPPLAHAGEDVSQACSSQPDTRLGNPAPRPRRSARSGATRLTGSTWRLRYRSSHIGGSASVLPGLPRHSA
jgi:hypothetical protein